MLIMNEVLGISVEEANLSVEVDMRQKALRRVEGFGI